LIIFSSNIIRKCLFSQLKNEISREVLKYKFGLMQSRRFSFEDLDTKRKNNKDKNTEESDYFGTMV